MWHFIGMMYFSLFILLILILGLSLILNTLGSIFGPGIGAILTLLITPLVVGGMIVICDKLNL